MLTDEEKESVFRSALAQGRGFTAEDIAATIDDFVTVSVKKRIEMSRAQRQAIADRYAASLESGRLRREGRHLYQLGTVDRPQPDAVQQHERQKGAAKYYRSAIRQARELATSATRSRRLEGLMILATLLPQRQPGTTHTIGTGKRQRSYIVGRHGEWRKVRP